MLIKFELLISIVLLRIKLVWIIRLLYSPENNTQLSKIYLVIAYSLFTALVSNYKTHCWTVSIISLLQEGKLERFLCPKNMIY